VYYLRIKIGSQVKHPVIEFEKSTQPEIRVNRIRDNESQLYYTENITCDFERLGTVYYFVNGWLCE
jgi:hypothetical protein